MLLFVAMLDKMAHLFLSAESMLDCALHLLTLCLRIEQADHNQDDDSMELREDKSARTKGRCNDGSSVPSFLNRLKQKIRQDDQEQGEGESMLDLLIKLSKSSELVEEKTYIDGVLQMIRSIDEECARIIDSSFEDRSKESSAKTARERARLIPASDHVDSAFIRFHTWFLPFQGTDPSTDETTATGLHGKEATSNGSRNTGS